MVSESDSRSSNGLLVLVATGLAATLVVTGAVFNAPRDLSIAGNLLTVAAFAVLAMAPLIRLHGLLAIGIALSGGCVGLFSIAMAGFSGWLRYEDPRWVGVTLGSFFVAYLAIAFALTTVGAVGLVKRDRPGIRRVFAAWYIGLAAAAIAIQQMAWIVKFTIWSGPT